MSDIISGDENKIYNCKIYLKNSNVLLYDFYAKSLDIDKIYNHIKNRRELLEVRVISYNQFLSKT